MLEFCCRFSVLDLLKNSVTVFELSKQIGDNDGSISETASPHCTKTNKKLLEAAVYPDAYCKTPGTLFFSFSIICERKKMQILRMCKIYF